jgi:hypothetical protein
MLWIFSAGRVQANWNRMMAATIIGMTGLNARAQDPLDLSFLLPTWDRVFTVRAGGGYKNNVTLAHSATQSSPFFSSGLEAIVNRLPKDGTQFTFLLSADDRRYFDSISVDKEQFAFAQAQVKHVFEDAGEVSLTADYFYLDQIQDVSVTETNLQALRVRGHGLTGRPALRLNFPGQYWAGVELAPTRQWLAAPLGDFTEFAGRFSVGRDYGYQSEISIRYEPGYRDYDSEPAVSSTGEPIPGVLRSFTMQEIRLNWRHHWDPERHWRTTTRLSYKINHDQGSGFFNYTKLSASEQLRFRTRSWEFSVEGKVSHYDYAVQTVSASSSEKRDRSDFVVTLQAERQLTKWLRVVGAYEYERALSNISVENYTASTISGSLQWSF